MQGCSNSIANALELLQSCSKPSMRWAHNIHPIHLPHWRAMGCVYFDKSQKNWPCYDGTALHMNQETSLIASSFVTDDLCVVGMYVLCLLSLSLDLNKIFLTEWMGCYSTWCNIKCDIVNIKCDSLFKHIISCIGKLWRRRYLLSSV